jgi:hypothetical protein
MITVTASYSVVDDEQEKCIRCSKVTNGIHTCTPTKQYRAGVVKGLKMALMNVNEFNMIGASSEYYHCFNKIKDRLKKVIKQHEGE